MSPLRIRIQVMRGTVGNPTDIYFIGLAVGGTEMLGTAEWLRLGIARPRLVGRFTDEQ